MHAGNTIRIDADFIQELCLNSKDAIGRPKCIASFMLMPSLPHLTRERRAQNDDDDDDDDAPSCMPSRCFLPKLIRIAARTQSVPLKSCPSPINADK